MNSVDAILDELAALGYDRSAMGEVVKELDGFLDRVAVNYSREGSFDGRFEGLTLESAQAAGVLKQLSTRGLLAPPAEPCGCTPLRECDEHFQQGDDVFKRSQDRSAD